MDEYPELDVQGAALALVVRQSNSHRSPGFRVWPRRCVLRKFRGVTRKQISSETVRNVSQQDFHVQGYLAHEEMPTPLGTL